MLVFGEIRFFETPHHDSRISENSRICVIFSGPQGIREATLLSRGIVITEKCGTKKKVFAFNRPFTRNDDQRLVMQVIQIHESGGHSLVGYGFCDLDIDSGKYSREICVSLWRPKSDSEIINKLRGTFNPLVDMNLALLPPEVNRLQLQAVASVGKVHIHIQKLAYR